MQILGYARVYETCNKNKWDTYWYSNSKENDPEISVYRIFFKRNEVILAGVVNASISGCGASKCPHLKTHAATVAAIKSNAWILCVISIYSALCIQRMRLPLEFFFWLSCSDRECLMLVAVLKRRYMCRHVSGKWNVCGAVYDGDISRARLLSDFKRCFQGMNWKRFTTL